MGVNVTSRNLNADGLIKIDSANSLRGFNGANSSMSLPTMERWKFSERYKKSARSR